VLPQPRQRLRQRREQVNREAATAAGGEAALEDTARLFEIAVHEEGVAEGVEGLAQAGGAADLLGQLDSLATVGESGGGKAAMAFQRRVVAVSDVPDSQVPLRDRGLDRPIEHGTGLVQATSAGEPEPPARQPRRPHRVFSEHSHEVDIADQLHDSIDPLGGRERHDERSPEHEILPFGGTLARERLFTVRDRIGEAPREGIRHADRYTKAHLEIAAPSDAREKRTALLHDGIELAFYVSQPGGLHSDPAERPEPELEDLRGIWDFRQELANPPDTPQRLGGSPQPDPLRRAVVPARRLERLAGLLPVVRQQSGVLVGSVGVVGLEGHRNGRMGALAALDDRGRWAVAGDSLWNGGTAPGPWIAGAMVEAGGYLPLAVWTFGVGAICMLLVTGVLRRLEAQPAPAPLKTD